MLGNGGCWILDVRCKIAGVGKMRKLKTQNFRLKHPSSASKVLPRHPVPVSSFYKV